MDLAPITIEIMQRLGGPGIAVIIALEAVFPPVPGEFLLPFAGVSAAADGQHVTVPIFWTTFGSVLGGVVVYSVGRALGLRRTRRLVSKVPLMDTRDVDAAVLFFTRHGFKAVALARFVPMVRTFISIPAGIRAMPLWLFALATGLGSGVWNAIFVITGYFFGEAGGRALENFVRVYSLIVLIIGVIATIVFLSKRWRERRQCRAKDAGAPAQDFADMAEVNSVNPKKSGSSRPASTASP